MAREKTANNPTNASTVQVVPASGPAPVAKVVPKKHVLYFIECADGIDRVHVEAIESKLKDASNDLLYLVLHTYGGDVYSSVRIMRILQSKFKKIIIIIPDYAYSSGTIMTLGGDEAWMAVDATLGPLDKPLEHPSDGTTISSLDVTQTLTNLASICSSTAAEIFTQLRQGSTEMKLPKVEAAKIAYDTATKIIHPIIDKIDPFNLQRGFREAKIGLYYAIDMLISRMMKGNIRQAVDTSHKLVNDFPSHGYGIFRDEAQFTLKLNIHHLELLPEWKELEPKFNELKGKYTKIVDYSVI